MVTRREIPFGRPWITDEDRRAVADVLQGPILTHGPQAEAFEREFAAFVGPEVHAVSVSSCMAALHLAFLSLELGPGDEVVVPAMTHTATVHAVEWVGARPIFADCDPDTGNVTPRSIEAVLTPRTRAVAVVHFVGIPCDMEAIAALARGRGLKLVEDCALAVGARRGGTHVGLFGDAGTFSFYPAKHLTCGEGGMLVTRHGWLAERARKTRAFGVVRPAAGAPAGLYDVTTLGLNYRMSELHAALGRSQLRRVEQVLRHRAVMFATLRAGLDPRRVLDGEGSSHYCLTMHVEEDRAALMARLKDAGIGSSIYYPHPVPRLEYYRLKYGFDPARNPGALQISDGTVSLPVGPHVGTEDIAHIVEQLS